MVTRNLNVYLDTLYSAFEMIASGITTVQHIHGWLPGKIAEVEGKANDVIRAYEDIGMRVSCYAVRDQNRLVYQADEEFVAGLAQGLARPDETLVRTLQDEPRRGDGHVPGHAHRASQQEPGQDPARPRQSPLVLGSRPDAVVRYVEEI